MSVRASVSARSSSGIVVRIRMRSVIGPCTLISIVVCFRRVAKKDETRAASRRRAPTAKRPTRTRRIVHLLLIFVASVIVVDALVGERGLVAMLRARHEYDELSASIARQRAENA